MTWDLLGTASATKLSQSLFSRQLVQEIGDAAQDHVRLGDVGVLAEEVGQLAQQRLGVLLLRRERLEPLLARLVEPLHRAWGWWGEGGGQQASVCSRHHKVLGTISTARSLLGAFVAVAHLSGLKSSPGRLPERRAGARAARGKTGPLCARPVGHKWATAPCSVLRHARSASSFEKGLSPRFSGSSTCRGGDGRRGAVRGGRK